MTRRLFPTNLQAASHPDLSVARPFLCDDCDAEVETFEVDPADGLVEFPTDHVVFADRNLTLRPCGHTNGAHLGPERGGTA